jgi:tetratricopeptide (TPR) repeat protein
MWWILRDPLDSPPAERPYARRATAVHTSHVAGRDAAGRTRRKTAVVLVFGVLLGCASSGPAQRCLRTPASSKVGDAELAHCQLAFTHHRSRRDLFDRFIRLLLARQRYAEVVHWSHEVLAEDESRTDAAYFLAVGLRKLGRCSDALPFYRLYARQHPRDPDPHFGIGICLESSGKSVEAREAYAAYLKLDQRPAYADWRSKATARLRALGGADQPTQQASPSGPAKSAAAPPTAATDASAAPSLGGTTTVSSAADCKALETLVEGDPFDTKAYEKLALCLASKQRHQEVASQMRTALRDNPDWPRGWLHLGRAQRAMGQKQPATSSLKKACKAGVAEACTTNEPAPVISP